MIQSDGGSSHNLRRLLDMDPCLVQAPRTSPQNMNKAIQKVQLDPDEDDMLQPVEIRLFQS